MRWGGVVSWRLVVMVPLELNARRNEPLTRYPAGAAMWDGPATFALLFRSTTHGSPGQLSIVPRIDARRTAALEVLDVAGNHRETVYQGCCRNQAVYYR